jgi:hypothetical protein
MRNKHKRFFKNSLHRQRALISLPEDRPGPQVSGAFKSMTIEKIPAVAKMYGMDEHGLGRLGDGGDHVVERGPTGSAHVDVGSFLLAHL